jgi:hypothetical protein
MNHCSLSETILSEMRTHVTHPVKLRVSKGIFAVKMCSIR